MTHCGEIPGECGISRAGAIGAVVGARGGRMRLSGSDQV
jgi:hypothetical protein